ncbi:MAG: hypothetical protein CSA65_06540 [Proteobacteria bacterium]|nr:MAG: hypothetical protein CSB49_02425 [Pseudomonadota bacterium]PIE18109.1 MAG: hypothetical protein CSA65_06540 [Pseudomonadota bacterium]
MAPLADDEDDLTILEELEGLTSARRSVILPTPGGLHPGELLTEAAGYGWTLVNAAFCYTRATGNRFNGSERGAWYACYGQGAVEAAQAEVCWHLTRELEATGVFDNTTSYRELFAGFTSRFHQLAPGTNDAALDSDPAIAYPAGQVLARDVLGSGGNGILYPSARSPRGRCLVALRPHLVQNVRQGATWDFSWDGTPTPTITLRP